MLFRGKRLEVRAGLAEDGLESKRMYKDNHEIGIPGGGPCSLSALLGIGDSRAE
jgi:hypothetical protein